ncbi:MAG TPA: glycosyltransferase family 2 protein [Nostocaceae cyanobacterium]|nr:glycosyltransferase family 2 protein [Nostocaceae cyanobacterium]
MPDLIIFLSRSLLSWLGIQVCLALVFLWYVRSHSCNLLPDEQLPKTAVILCLRGADPFLPHCVRSLLQQNYPEYDLKLIVDSQEDPAYKIATEAIAEISATNVQISFLREIRHNCSLKCSALLQAISDLDNSYKVIALVDADTIVHPHWLRELVSPLADEKIGVTTGNRWFVPTGNYWGSLVRYSGNISTVVQMFLFQVPWGGTLAIKTEVLQQTGLIDTWGQVFNDDMLLHKILKRHKLKIKFIPSLIMLNREEIDLLSLLESLKRLILSARLYHPNWLAIIGDAISSILFPSLVILLILKSLIEAEWYLAGLLFTCYSIYTIGLLLLMLLMQLGIRPIFKHQGQTTSQISLSLMLKMLIIIPLTQWIYGIAILSSLSSSIITWRGLSYRIQGSENIRLIEYRPYQWLDQPINSKVSL